MCCIPCVELEQKASGKFERISWDEALDEITSRFQQTIADYGAEAIMPCSYLGHEGLLNGLTVGDAFFNRSRGQPLPSVLCVSPVPALLI